MSNAGLFWFYAIWVMKSCQQAQLLINDNLERIFHFAWQERQVDKRKPSIFGLCEFGKDVIDNFLLQPRCLH